MSKRAPRAPKIASIDGMVCHGKTACSCFVRNPRGIQTTTTSKKSLLRRLVTLAHPQYVPRGKSCYLEETEKGIGGNTQYY